MGKSLVIVESPAKAKTINRYLGSDYVVKSSVGHVRDLPVSGGQKSPVDHSARAREAAKTRRMAPEEKAAYKARKAREQLVRRMGVDPEHGWEAHYDVLPGKEKVVAELQRLAREADRVYLATDRDREGEAIAWHLREVIGGDEDRYRRVVFNEITRRAIQEAFEDPGHLDMNRVQAQQARRFLDRVVGYMVSPLLWSKIARGLSAGRVQSVAVRLIVEREREIQAFVPEEYWELFADLRPEPDAGSEAPEPVRFQVVRRDGQTFRPTNEGETGESLEALRDARFEVTDREDKQTSQRPPAPFITSTLQQSASTRLGFSVKKTMTLAQRLYESGRITYMRTDSTNLSQEAVEGVRGLIGERFGREFLPERPNVYGSREQAQEAHEAIRPSDVRITADDLGSGVEPDAQRLYDLIWRQFVACQMPPARYTSTTVTVTAGSHELRLRGRVLRFAGFTRVLPPSGRGAEDREVPDLPVGTRLALVGLDPQQHFTKPPPRYGEASLVRELEKRGIGRPSTYASIISTIQERGYVTLKNRRFYAEKIGEIVTSRLRENFQDLLDYDFTKQMEERLDQVADGELGWRELLDRFYADFTEKLDSASGPHGMRANDPTEVDFPCPKCGRNMMVRTGTTGVFLGCSGYSLPPKERCTTTLNLIPGTEIADTDADEEAESKVLRGKHRCPECGTSMDAYLVDEHHKLHICGRNPDCPGFEVEEGTFRIKGYDGPTIECDKCGAEMQLKSGRFGKYFGCTAEACTNTRKLLRNGQPAPPKMDPVPMPELPCEKVDDTYVLRDGAAGLFLAASQFPKHRETRAPRVSELLSHQNEIDPKYTYLFSAPTQDPEGRPTVVRFSRKTGDQYVQSENEEGKPTGWKAVYRDGRWVPEQARSRAGEGRGGGRGKGASGARGRKSRRGAG